MEGSNWFIPYFVKGFYKRANISLYVRLHDKKDWYIKNIYNWLIKKKE